MPWSWLNNSVMATTSEIATSPRLATAWREHLAVRLAELESATLRLTDADAQEFAATCLRQARGAIENRPTLRRFGSAWTGVDVERAWASTHALEVALVRGLGRAEVTAMLPSLVETCAAILPTDPRVSTLRTVASAGRTVTDADQTLAADTLASAYTTSDAQHVRVRSFRNVLLGSTALLTVLALIIGAVASIAPGAFAVCESVGRAAAATCPTGKRHPTGGDVFVIEVLGMFAAAITGAVAIRRLRGTSTPYAVPLASLGLKVPIGALTALGGLMLLRAGFGPDIDNLTQAEVSGYALVFGASQQLFMQFVDKRAQFVLNETTTPGDLGQSER